MESSDDIFSNLKDFTDEETKAIMKEKAKKDLEKKITYLEKKLAVLSTDLNKRKQLQHQFGEILQKQQSRSIGRISDLESYSYHSHSPYRISIHKPTSLSDLNRDIGHGTLPKGFHSVNIDHELSNLTNEDIWKLTKKKKCVICKTYLTNKNIKNKFLYCDSCAERLSPSQVELFLKKIGQSGIRKKSSLVGKILTKFGLAKEIKK